MKCKIFTLMFLFSLSAMAQEAGVTVGLKNFRGNYYSLLSVTDVKPTPEIVEKYKAVQSRLSKEGRVDEMSSQMLLAVKDLSGLVCQEFAKKYKDPSKASGNFDDLLKDMSERIYGRRLSITEAQKITSLTDGLRPQISRPFVVCVVMTSSVEFLVQK